MSPSPRGPYLHSILAAGTGPSLNQGVARVNDATDPVSIGMQLCFEGLVLLVLALKIPKTSFQNRVLHFTSSQGAGILRRKGVVADLRIWGKYRLFLEKAITELE